MKRKLHPSDPKAVGHFAGAIHTYRTDIFVFMEDMWGLTPQKPKPEYQRDWEEVLRATGDTWLRLSKEVNVHWFGDWNEERQEWEWYHFEKGKTITWQQTLILLATNKANGVTIPALISVASGHGIGKSTTCSWLILWFLYCFYDAQVPVTAPTSAQMHDVLWKELAKWISKMPPEVSVIFDWKQDYIRMNYSPETWFARARTSSKENTEAIAGVHSDHVLIVVDEASGVPEQVYNTAEGALTSGNVRVILISNPTRTSGYFFDTHHKMSEKWQTFVFSGEETPMVDRRYVEAQAVRHGEDSQEYGIRVLGKFPKEDSMDDSGYLQLITRDKVFVMPRTVDPVFAGRVILGVDPSGEGDDEAAIVGRDDFRAFVLATMKTTNEREIAERVLTFIDRYKVHPRDVVIDGFGIGTRIGQIISEATQGRYQVYTALVGNAPKKEEEMQPQFFERLPEELEQSRINGEGEEEDTPNDLYLNIRALMYFRARRWLLGGGTLVDFNTLNSDWAEELANIKYKRSLQGNKLQLMSKKEMQKLRIKSPNKADALSLTFLRQGARRVQSEMEAAVIRQQERVVKDRYAIL